MVYSSDALSLNSFCAVYLTYVDFSARRSSSEYFETFEMDHAKRFAWTRCVPHWSTWAPQTISCYDVPCK